MTATRYTIEFQPRIPERLSRLSDLASNLWYSWDASCRSLFVQLDVNLWRKVGHNPKVFLRRIDQKRLEEAANDPAFMQVYKRVISAFDAYMNSEIKGEGAELLDPDEQLVAYFSAEFGFHESLPIYSGGLGILAGDHCKSASDLDLPFVGVGLMYRQGYFFQTIDGKGNQVAHYADSKFEDLPVTRVVNQDGSPLSIPVNIGLRMVKLWVWKAQVGHIELYLIDSDHPDNSAEDRDITHRLYGGDLRTRLQQEICLGVGGVRVLRALGKQPTAWHVNEGHPAFLILERVREKVKAGIDFAAAWEAVAGSTVFTTHTPVPAGHDVFPMEMMEEKLGWIRYEMGLNTEQFAELGRKPSEPGRFNMTALGLRGSNFHNGVSKIHGEVASQMEADLWPEVTPEENPIDHITNGVHMGTWLARAWRDSFDTYLGGDWVSKLTQPGYWSRLDDIPNYLFWSIHQSLKSNMLHYLRQRAREQLIRNGCSAPHAETYLDHLDPLNANVLTVGFARRFATYKRATLLFSDLDRLDRLVNGVDEKSHRPVVFLFAGKAHPADGLGQDLIRRIHEVSKMERFRGKILLLEGYDMALARYLLIGCDVWLNNPRFPLEASGTSGQKAAMNGVVNCSILDGWWGEGYEGDNGWAIHPHTDEEEADELYELFEQEIVPLYYARNGHGFSEGWVKKAKRAMISALPRFNAHRMVLDYATKFYAPASELGQLLHEDGLTKAQERAQWKQRVRAAWPHVALHRIDAPDLAQPFDEALEIEVDAVLPELGPKDVVVECLLFKNGDDKPTRTVPLVPELEGEPGFVFRFQATVHAPTCGLFSYQIRMRPYHPLLAHPNELGLMVWL
ncbi:MAG: DUF3417 domain-containing protein [Alphaproteobacteria bacterium CG_4_10_14_0_2_um_filter_63_37]|nr:MAG: alpha-glucan phosphorylase [Proteobacteria bacterium CG1_02_64_396]PJA25510.1 MAG: DUF3417 domain-containing protein [Alphaproteobacteria bacterium CG_4_10_14_0_2_um_filter_63_37]